MAWILTGRVMTRGSCFPSSTSWIGRSASSAVLSTETRPTARSSSLNWCWKLTPSRSPFIVKRADFRFLPATATRLVLPFVTDAVNEMATGIA